MLIHLKILNNMKLIQTEDYLLLIDEVGGFKRGGWNYEIDNNIPIYQFGYDIDEYPGNKIIAYHPLTKEAKELDLPLLPEHDIEGFRIIQSKQFSLEDIKKAFEAGVAWHVNPNISEIDAYTSFIQSLSTQQLPKEFIPNYQRVRDLDNKDINGDYNSKLVLKTTTNSEGKEELVGTYKY